MERALSRLTLGRGGPRDLGALRDGLSVAADLQAQLMAADAPVPELTRAASDLGDHAVLVDRLSRALDETLPLITRDGGFIQAGYAPIWTNFASCATKAVNISLPCRRATQTTPASRR